VRRTKEEERRIRKGGGRTGNKEERRRKRCVQEIKNAGRMNKEIENMKRRAKLGSSDQTSRSDNHQIYCSTEELAVEVILWKISRI
jgi:hypothetical protein